MARAAVVDIAGLDSIEQLVPDFERSLRAQHKSPRTIEAYTEAARLLDRFLSEKGMPRQVRSIGREHVEAFIDDQLSRWKPATAAVRYRSLQAFFKWCESDGEITSSPMLKMKPPRVEPPEVPVIPDDDLGRLLKTTQGRERTFDDYRDAALMRMFIDTGARLSEVTGLQLDDVDLDAGEITVLGKGRRVRRVPFGDATRKALRQYLRARDLHSLAKTNHLWLGARGQQLTQSGIAQIVRRRCREAGIDAVHVHQFRHTAASQRFSGGMSEGDAMRLFGWRTREMTSRYASSTADDRARDAARRQGFHGDRL